LKGLWGGGQEVEGLVARTRLCVVQERAIETALRTHALVQLDDIAFEFVGITWLNGQGPLIVIHHHKDIVSVILKLCRKGVKFCHGCDGQETYNVWFQFVCLCVCVCVFFTNLIYF
jgi:hypothetical protein